MLPAYGARTVFTAYDPRIYGNITAFNENEQGLPEKRTPLPRCFLPPFLLPQTRSVYASLPRGPPLIRAARRTNEPFLTAKKVSINVFDHAALRGRTNEIAFGYQLRRIINFYTLYAPFLLFLFLPPPSSPLSPLSRGSLEFIYELRPRRGVAVNCTSITVSRGKSNN